MHERTQRAIARMTFVFCCALPTAATLCMILLTWTPWWHRRTLASIEARLSHETGLTMSVDDFKRSSPSTLWLFGVKVFDPETGDEIARVREAVWAGRGDRVSILLQQPELQSSQLPHTWKMIHDRFLCRPEQTSKSIQLAANDLTIHSRVGPLTLRDVDAWIRPGLNDETIEAAIRCLPAGHFVDGEAASPIDIAVTRNRGTDQPSTGWMLSTGQAALPCSALAEFVPTLEALGDNAMFSGTMRWQVSRDGWAIDLGDSLISRIDVGKWCEELPHRWTGTATVGLDRCRVVSDKGVLSAVDIAGQLDARDGLVGHSLLRSSATHLGFTVAGPLDHVVAYDQLAIGFDLIGPLLTVHGVCAGFADLPSGVVVSADGRAIAESSGATMQAARLQAVFAPEHSVMVPLSRQTSPLMQILMPPSRATPPGHGSVPRITKSGPIEGEPSINQPH